MGSSKPNVGYLRVAQLFEENFTSHSEDNKAQFKGVYSLIQIHKPKERQKVAKEMKKAGETIKLDSAKRAYDAVLNLCLVYTNVPDNKVNYTAIEWTIFKRTMTLIKRIVTHYQIEDKLKVVDAIGSIWESGMSSHRYNNLLEAKIKELSEDYPVPTKVETVDLATIWNKTKELSQTEKRWLLVLLKKELED